MLGASSITKNIGRLKNSGFEFLLDTKNIAKEDFNWKTSFNIGINTSEVVTLPWLRNRFPKWNAKKHKHQ